MEPFSQAQLFLIFLTSTGSFLLVEVIRPFIKKCFTDDKKEAAILRLLAMFIGAAIACSISEWSSANLWLGVFAGGFNSAVISTVENRILGIKNKEP